MTSRDGRVDRDDVGADRQRGPAGRLGGRDQLVDLPLPVRGVAQDDGAGHVGVVAVDGRAEVELQEVAVAQHGGVGPVVRDGGVGAGGDDRLEGRRLGTQRQHAGVELAADLQLGAPGPQRALGGQLGQRLVGDRAGAAQRLDLVVVLDRAQGLDGPADRGQLGHGPPPAASASTFSSAASPSTVRSWDS